MVIAVDFDGTLCMNAWPKIGKPNIELIETLKKVRGQGHKIILWTNRSGDLLLNAIWWSANRGLLFDAVNENLSERIEKYGNDCRKISADLYIDDRAATPVCIYGKEWNNDDVLLKLVLSDRLEKERSKLGESKN